MTETHELWKIEQVVELATKLPMSWFRGHARVHNELTPRIFRKEWENEIYRGFRPDLEFNIIEDFKRGAPALTDAVPPYEDHVGWLFLMQHHGAPTRLLDWTESALIALYFAVEVAPGEDGELWMMFPYALNRKSGFDGIPTPNNPIMRFLAGQPSHGSPQKLATELGLDAVPQYPIAVHPPLHFARMVAQLSTFTSHPRPVAGGTIPELLPDPRSLLRYIIPADCKRQLILDLSALGIWRRSLFPDLDALSRSIITKHRVVAYTPPEPPRWRDYTKRSDPGDARDNAQPET